ncbi:hypothetical protein BDL97_12G081200 [Sphagnum fallax]|nr:hypothetical protein BDL97_12G081200 [Sphagnum fallax]KAH8946199.1 hypothetical protein BDL97_12G081200 [Sphagnum fallax]KAH8946200.1 hypothetical protein BDL97_12G081200 [Sphagnum fallax]KAH8946203.1 hypothetical protein BDL97_12G081200 [Sphagnum fallax]
MDGAAFQDFVNGFFKVPHGLFGNKTRQPGHQSKLVEPAGNSQPIRKPEIDPQFIQETRGGSNVTQVTDSKLRKGDEIAGLHQEIQQTGANPKDLREAIVILQLSAETPSKPKELKESGSGIRRFEESETRSESAEEILSRPEPKFVEETTKTPWIVKETQEMPLPPIMVIQKTIIEETSEGKAIVTTLFEVLEIDESVSSHRNDVMVT